MRSWLIKQPSRQPFFHVMQSITSRELSGLDTQDHGIALQLALERGTFRQKASQDSHVDAIGRSVPLRDDSQGAGFETENYRQANEAFFADQTDFHTLTIRLHGENRRHSVVQEIARLDDFAGLMQYLMKPEPHELERGKNSGALGTRKSAQNDVANGTMSIISVCFKFVKYDPG